MKTCSENRCINLDNETINFELPQFSRDADVTDTHWKLESAISPQTVEGSHRTKLDDGTMPNSKDNQTIDSNRHSSHNQTFGHFDLAIKGMKLTATERYLTHKAGMQLEPELSEIQT